MRSRHIRTYLPKVHVVKACFCTLFLSSMLAGAEDDFIAKRQPRPATEGTFRAINYTTYWRPVFQSVLGLLQ